MFHRSTTSIVATIAVLAGGSAAAQEAANISSTKLIESFTQLLNTPAGVDALNANLATAIATNNGATPAQRDLAIYDNTIAALVGSFSNGQLVTDGLGQKLSDAFDKTNALFPNFTAKTFSPVYADLMLQVNMLVQSDSSFAKNFFANGSVHGDPAHPAVGISLPPGGMFNVYDKAYLPDPANANTVGNSRPVQVAPASIETFSGPDYFGKIEDTSAILPTLKSNASFPSGHSAFGFASTTLLAMMVPEKFQELLARGAEYGNSRIVLGAHYPMDVIGARIMTLQSVARMLNNDDEYTDREYRTVFGEQKTSTDDFRKLMATSATDLRTMLETGCGDTIARCAATSAPDRFSDMEKTRADYLYRLTYDLGTVGDATLDPVVPEGAEVLLASRFGYLDDDQRREVLATTELPSGAPLDDGSGWARLDLFKAANGYGAFRDDVTVEMNVSDGGFGASDTWRNDITGPGGLTKRGDGRLELAGRNSYAGPTVVEAGELAVTGSIRSTVSVDEAATLSGSGSFFGDVVVAGLLSPGASPGMMVFESDLTLTSTSRTLIEITGTASGQFDRIRVMGDLSLQDATLDVAMLGGFVPGRMQTFLLFDLFGTRSGAFAGLEEGGVVGRFGRRDLFITYAGGDGDDIAVFTTAAPIPVPAAFGLMLTGLAAIGAAGPRRRRA